MESLKERQALRRQRAEDAANTPGYPLVDDGEATTKKAERAAKKADTAAKTAEGDTANKNPFGGA